MYATTDSFHPACGRWVWESQADGSFTVYEDADGEPLERGTEIRIHLKDEASEYADEDKLKVGAPTTNDYTTVDGDSLWAKSLLQDVFETERMEVELEFRAGIETPPSHNSL